MRVIILLLSAFICQLANAAPAERVISLAPHTTELAFAAGLGSKLIAVSEHSDYPLEAKNLPKVANYQGIKIERIIALKPDLIIAWPAGNPSGELAKLKQFGLNIYYAQTDSLDDIATNIEQLSQYASDPQIGRKNAQDFRSRLLQLKKQYANSTSVRYFYQLSQQPLMTLAQGKWPSEVFSFCGGENIFEDSQAPYPQVGKEQVIVRDPQVIFTSEQALANGDNWQQWRQISAVKNHFIWSLNSDWLNRPTPRTLKAIEQVCGYFSQVRQHQSE